MSWNIARRYLMKLQLVCIGLLSMQLGQAFASGSRVAFVDSALADYQALAQQLPQDTEIVYLTADKNGLEQIANHLQGRSGIDAIHLISHGREGEVQLGNLWLSAENIPTNQASLKKLGSALRPGGDIMIYGCKVAAGTAGVGFLQALVSVTGKDVAASSNWTGTSTKGGGLGFRSSSGRY